MTNVSKIAFDLICTPSLAGFTHPCPSQMLHSHLVRGCGNRHVLKGNTPSLFIRLCSYLRAETKCTRAQTLSDMYN